MVILQFFTATCRCFKTAKGLVRIGDNINVNSEGLISVSAATNSVFGVVKLGGNIINDQNNNLSFEWNEF